MAPRPTPYTVPEGVLHGATPVADGDPRLYNLTLLPQCRFAVGQGLKTSTVRSPMLRSAKSNRARVQPASGSRRRGRPRQVTAPRRCSPRACRAISTRPYPWTAAVYPPAVRSIPTTWTASGLSLVVPAADVAGGLQEGLQPHARQEHVEVPHAVLRLGGTPGRRPFTEVAPHHGLRRRPVRVRRADTVGHVAGVPAGQQRLAHPRRSPAGVCLHVAVKWWM